MSATSTLQVRTNLFANKKFNSSGSLVKGNASPLTTQAGRISSGVNGVIWAGKLSAWSVFIEEDRSWSTVMADASSPVCGLVGIVLAALQSIDAIDESASQEEIQEVVETLLETDVIFEMPNLKPDELLDLYEACQEGSFHIQSELELSIGVAKDGSLSIKGVFLGDLIANPGKLSLVESNRLKISGAFSSCARAQEVDLDVQKNAFKSALNNQRQKNLDRRAKYSKPVVATESNSAGVVIDNPAVIPPAF